MSDELTQEQIDEQAEQEAEKASFDAGFSGAVEPEQEHEPEPEPEGQPEGQEPTLEDQMWERLTSRYDNQLRNISGHIGGIKSTLQELQAASEQAATDTLESGGEAPSRSQINAALASGEKLAALKEDYPEWAEAVEESMNLVLAQVGSVGSEGVAELEAKVKATQEALTATQEEAKQLVAKGRQLARLDAAFPSWEDDIADPMYMEWLQRQPKELQEKHFNSEAAKDAIEVLTAYYEASNKELPAQSRQSQERRLESAVAPTDGRSVQRRSHKTEHDEFTEAFNAR